MNMNDAVEKNRIIDKLIRAKMTANSFREAAEKSLEGALISGNDKLVATKYQECKDTYESYLDATVNQYKTLLRITKR